MNQHRPTRTQSTKLLTFLRVLHPPGHSRQSNASILLVPQPHSSDVIPTSFSSTPSQYTLKLVPLFFCNPRHLLLFGSLAREIWHRHRHPVLGPLKNRNWRWRLKTLGPTRQPCWDSSRNVSCGRWRISSLSSPRILQMLQRIRLGLRRKLRDIASPSHDGMVPTALLGRQMFKRIVHGGRSTPRGQLPR